MLPSIPISGISLLKNSYFTKSLSFNIPYNKNFWKTIIINIDIEVIILKENLEVLVKIRAYRLKSTIN